MIRFASGDEGIDETLDHSEWIEDFDATLAKVLQHVGLPHDPNCARFHESDRLVRTASKYQVRRPINAADVGRWKEFEQELAPLIAGAGGGRRVFGRRMASAGERLRPSSLGPRDWLMPR